MCGCRGASGFLLLPGEGKRLLLLAMADERLLLAIEERLLLATEERLLLLVGVEGLRAGATLWPEFEERKESTPIKCEVGHQIWRAYSECTSKRM